MKKFIFCGLILFLTACQPLVPINQASLVTAVGSASISAQQATSLEDRKFKAMRASKLNAYKELSEQIYGLQVSSETKISNDRLTVEQSMGVTNGVIRGARVIGSYQVGDSYVTELELDLGKMREMAEVGEIYYVPRDNQVIF